MPDSAYNAIGYFSATTLLYPAYTIFMATAFLLFFLLDRFIRTFDSGSQPHSYHRHFIDPRPINRTVHLWTTFHASLFWLRLGSLQPTSTCCVSAGYWNISWGKLCFPATFTSLQAFAYLKFIRSNVSLHDRKTIIVPPSCRRVPPKYDRHFPRRR